MEYEIRLEEFQGPFELLFELIEKDKLDIYNIPIHQITADFIRAMEERQLPAAQIADFVLFAAMLLEIKSRMLLPDAALEPITLDDEADPRHELLTRLLEYKRVREIGQFLTKREQRFLFHVYGDETAIKLPLPEESDQSMEVDLLADAFRNLLARAARFSDGGAGFFSELKREHFSVSRTQADIVKKLRQVGRLPFDELFNLAAPRGQWIATFLALLKLQQEQTIRIAQSDSFSPLDIELRSA